VSPLRPSPPLAPNASDADHAPLGTPPRSDIFGESDLPLLDQLRVRNRARRNARGRETEIVAQLERTYQSRIAQLEEHVNTLNHKMRIEKSHHDQQLKAKQKENDNLRKVMHREISELQRRQEAVEAAGPAFHVQVQAARDQMRDLFISEATYLELCKIPEQDRLLADAVRVAVHEALADLKRENERLRKSSAADRESCLRLEEEAQRARRAESMAENRARTREKDCNEQVEALEARLERVEEELRETSLRAEVLSSKGAVFDELKSEHEELRRKHDAALAHTASLERAKEEFEALRVAHRDALHRGELLAQDKAHLTKQAELLQAQVARLEGDVAERSAKLLALRQQRDRLQDKLVEGTSDNRAEYEVRLQGEIARLREESAREVDRVRAEMEHGYDRELRVVRELRDSAVAEARRNEELLSAARQQLEDAGLRNAARAKEAEVLEARLAGKVEILLLEKQQLSATAAERGNRVQALQAEADRNADQVRTLREQLFAAEHDATRRVTDLEARLEAATEKLQHYELLESNLDNAILTAGAAQGQGGIGGSEAEAEGLASGPAAVVRALEGAVPIAVRRRVKQALVLAARCHELETTSARQEAALRESRERCRSLEADLQAARNRADRVGQPQSFVLEELDRIEARAVRAERRCRQLAEDLRESERERGQMRQDIEALLGDRESLDALRSAVTGGAPAPLGRQPSVRGSRAVAPAGLAKRASSAAIAADQGRAPLPRQGSRPGIPLARGGSVSSMRA